MKSVSKEQQYVKEGYEQVREAFEHLYKRGDDKRSQLCVFVGDECVVDLCGGVDHEDFTTVFSCSKNISSIMLGMLHDKGLFQYEDPVAKYWPEFAQNGKDKLTIQEVMKHEGGLRRLSRPICNEEFTTEEIKKNTMGKIIEEDKLFYYLDDAKREYHGFTRDWVSGELFRRIEPNGYTYGEYIKHVLKGEAGINSPLFCGVDEENYAKHTELKMFGAFTMFKQMWGGPEKHFVSSGFSSISALLKNQEPWAKKRDQAVKDQQLPEFKKNSGGAEMFRKAKGKDDQMFPFSKEFCKGECPSANMNANARSLARLAAFMANKGTFQGKTLMSEQTWENLHSNSTVDWMEDPALPHTTYTKGGFHDFKHVEEDNEVARVLSDQHNNGREGFYGWYGAAGAVMQWNPELKIGFGYIPYEVNMIDMWALRGKHLQIAAARAAKGEQVVKKEEKSSTCNIF